MASSLMKAAKSLINHHKIPATTLITAAPLNTKIAAIRLASAALFAPKQLPTTTLALM